MPLVEGGFFVVRSEGRLSEELPRESSGHPIATKPNP
jgi:hypothetical protein